MPLIATRGAASAQGFGEFAQTTAPVYIEDVFSTWLYVGNGSTQTITNGIDLSGKGGFVWTKNRDTAGTNHILCDTARGITNYINSNNTNGQNANGVLTDVLTGTTTSGYTLGADATLQAVNVSTKTYVSWTFREQPKFFDVVTYTGDNTSSKAISHNLGSVPGCVIVKRTDSGSHWFVWHRSTSGTPNNDYTLLNQTAATAVATNAWSSNAFTSTEFYVSNNLSTNVSGATYVAYVFAHNAGGFGLTGSDNVITCGSYTGNGGTLTVNLGYEPQWILVKRSDSTSNWAMIDVMRGWVVGASSQQQLFANTSGAETGDTFFGPTATGFSANLGGTWNTNGGTYIYIAIRRGPMKVPTTGTSVFSPITYAGNSTASRVISGLINAPDWVLYTARNASAGQNNHITGSRLQGGGRYLLTEDASSEASTTAYGVQTYGQTSVTLGTATTSEQNASGVNYILYGMGRAPGFFDVVCYTGTGANTTISHNLGVAPELVILKRRNGVEDWPVLQANIPTQATLNGTFSGDPPNSSYFGNGTSYVAPTSTVFSVGTNSAVNASGGTYVAYLFASCPGVSKVGSYTGTGALQTVNCGFTTGARFVLIRRTDSTGDWYVYDSARGISSGNDPYLLLNSTAAEVTGTNYVDTTSVGFQVTAAAPAGINANGGSYLFLAIA